MDGQTANFKLFIIVPCKIFILTNVNLKNYFLFIINGYMIFIIEIETETRMTKY